MSVKVGILICGHFIEEVAAVYEDYRALYAPMLGEGFDCQPYFVVDGEMPASVDEQDGWLVSGSRHGAYEDHAWIPPLEDFLRAAYAAAVPVVGICFGHQILAQALGGRVEKFGGGWSIGPTEYAFADGHRETVVAFHQDQITAKPEAAEVIASTDFCAFAGLAYPGPTISFQPHPEFTQAFIGDLLDAYQDRLDPAVVADASARLGTPLSQGGMIGQIREVLRGGEATAVSGVVAEAAAVARATEAG